ncbi:L,D-transpeptidase family protein [Fluviibacterium sp. DFM31]|uniref:L,D-transpeptidase family protein n=1 Tax=Meridianimarinicoccus marinus TaxID=3231483 RepID=A0ABV3L8E3_9RHOB
MPAILRSPILRPFWAFLSVLLLTGAAFAQSGDQALRQAIASSVARDATLQQFYAQRNYQPMWMSGSAKDKRRQRDFLKALKQSGDHGLPTGAYNIAGLSQMAGAKTVADKAKAEIAFSKTFSAYAQDIQSGILTPSRVSKEIDRAAPRRGAVQTLVAFSKSSPSGFLKALPPQRASYKALMEEKTRLEKIVGSGGWGPKVGGKSYKMGQSSQQIVVMRARLRALGYGKGGKSPTFDQALQQDLARFQRDHGLNPDGVAGPATLAELNRTAQDRLTQVIVGMERERWMNFPMGKRHVLVNIPDYSAKIIDNGRVTFETRAVVGQNRSTHRTPEFSDVMEFMVINPTWNVPYSIATKEYLPMLKQNPNAVSHLQLLDQNGNRVSRGSVNFASYSEGNFPFRLKEPPSDGNALGLVKFMFPNQHNIYLHDTPHKTLFSRGQRAFSHGCIRLADPFDFAYTLLAKQTTNPKGTFKTHLDTGRESVLQLKQPVPVHLVYQTAFVEGSDDVQFRVDIYGRDAMIFNALAKAGVSLRAIGG